MDVKLSATVYESFHGNTIQTNSLSFILLIAMRRNISYINHNVLLFHFFCDICCRKSCCQLN